MIYVQISEKNEARSNVDFLDAFLSDNSVIWPELYVSYWRFPVPNLRFTIFIDDSLQHPPENKNNFLLFPLHHAHHRNTIHYA